MARVVVIGAGSIGGYFAGEAARAGHEVALGVRTPFERLRVHHPDGRREEVPAAVHTDPAELDPGDWVLVATKAHQTPAAARWLRAACGPGTRAVAVLQNGVDHEERVRPHVGGVAVLPAIVLCGAEAVGPGEVVHHGHSTLQLPAGELGEGLAELLEGTGARVELVEDFVSAAWRKLVSNVTASPIMALTGQRMGVMRRPDVAALAVGLAEECLAVARAEGARLPDGTARESAASLAAANPEMGASMLYDRLAGRPLEHEALTGAVVRHGRAHGLPTPLNDAVYALLSAISDAAS